MEGNVNMEVTSLKVSKRMVIFVIYRGYIYFKMTLL